MADNRPNPTINTARACHDISNRFNEVTRSIRDNTKGSKLYEWQTEIAYLLNEIARGPVYIAPKHVGTAQKRITEINQEINAAGFANRQKGK